MQVEIIWVLESGCKLSKKDIIQILEHLEINRAFVQEDDDLCHHPLALFRTTNVDYSDSVVLSNCQSRKHKLYTFAERLAKLKGAAPVPM